MSHPLVAAVWEQLGRTDIANILREIIGDHAAQLAVSQVQNGLVAHVEPLVRMVFWIKAIFDLQRSYLQGLTSVRQCPPSLLLYLLPSETIYSTLMYLIRVKAELLPMTAAMVRDRTQYRYFLAEAVLAGVRLLLLRGESMHAEMRSNLGRAMKTAWQHPGLSNEESYLVNVLLPRAINDIGCADISNGQSPLAASGRHTLPSFSSGLYPFSSVPETHITDLLTGLVGNGPDHTSSFWTLFDTSWAAESALIQCHVDSRRVPQQQGDSDMKTFNIEEAFVQTREARKKLARTILAASDGQTETPALRILATIILSQSADGNPPLQTRKVRDAWNQMAAFRNELDSSLSHFVRWLINRRVQLWDCNGELEAVSHEYQRHLTQWLHSSSPAEAERNSNEADKAGAVYVVDCPFVHPVPKAMLEEQLKKNGINIDELQVTPELLSVDASCPLCPEGTKVQHARIIEPLEHFSGALHSGSESGSILSRQSTFGSISGRTASRSSSLSHSTRRSVAFGDTSKPSSPNGSMPKMRSSQSLYTMASSLNHLSAPWLDKHQQKQTVKSLSRELKGVKLSLPVRRASSIRKGLLKEQRLSRQPRFCFSSSGKSIFFWGEDSSCISHFDIPTVDGQKPESFRYDVSGVQCVAAGEHRCAVVALVGQHYELLVFGPNSASAEAHVTIDTPGLSLCSNCMTMSRDDKHIAFILENQVHVYELGDIYELGARSIQKATVNCSPKLALEIAATDRKIEFSVDGNELVVTRLEGQSVYFEVWHRDAETWNTANDGFYSIKNTSIDGSLTGAFYDNLHRSIYLTAFSSKEYPLVFSTSNGKAAGSPFSAKIVHSAQSPSGSRYAMANGLNEIYICDYKPDEPLNPIRIKKASSKISSSAFKPGRLLLSFLQENILLVFWSKDEKLVLRTVRLNDNGEVVSDYDLRTDLERLMTERAPNVSSRTQSPRLGVSSSPVVEKRGPSITLRPDLPELASN